MAHRVTGLPGWEEVWTWQTITCNVTISRYTCIYSHSIAVGNGTGMYVARITCFSKVIFCIRRMKLYSLFSSRGCNILRVCPKTFKQFENVTFCLLIHPHCPTHINTWPMKIVATDDISICCNGKPINCKLAYHKWWKYLHGMLGGLLDCDDIDIVISSVWTRQLLAIKVEHRQSASVSIYKLLYMFTDMIYTQ